MAEDRRRLVDQRTAHCNELKAVLKPYFPEVLQLEAAKIYADFIVAFLLKYPTLQAAQKAGPAKLRKLFYGIGTRAKAEDRVQTILNATPLSNDEVLMRTCCNASHRVGQFDQSLQSTGRRTTHGSPKTFVSMPTTQSSLHFRVLRI